MKLESTFENARILMRWGVLGMPICALLAFIAVSDLDMLLFVSLGGYVCALLCYMSGAYLFSKATRSSLFMLNCARFFTLLVFIILLSVLTEIFNDDMFGLIIICLSCAIFSVVFLLLERKIALELYARTEVRYFVLGFRVRLVFVALFVGICLIIAFSIGTGLELQSSIAALNNADNLKHFWQQNPLVLVYCAIALIMLVSLFVSSLLYIMAYWKICGYVSEPQSSGCKGLCGCK